MSLSLARSLAPEVRVNVVAPGHTNTPWHPNVRGPERAAEVESRYAAIAPLKSVSEAEDVADAIVWLIDRREERHRRDDLRRRRHAHRHAALIVR